MKFDIINSIIINTKGVAIKICFKFFKYLNIKKNRPKKIDKDMGNNIAINAYDFVDL